MPIVSKSARDAGAIPECYIGVSPCEWFDMRAKREGLDDGG